MIFFNRLTFTYPNAERPALHDLTLHVLPGSFTLLVGASGSGKSTLLRCINGLVPHFSGGTLRGTVRVNGLDPVAATPQVMSRHVGFVFQDPEAQFVVNHVEDEIAFALEHAAVPRQEMQVRVEEALGLLELTPLRDRRIETLSGGERQRVAIAAALALRPRILVLDEPTSQLDPQSAEDVLQSLVRLNTDLGLTVVLAEHRLERVLPSVDHMIYLPPCDGGPTAAISGAPREVLREMPLVPPIIEMGKALGWQPLPLSVEEGVRGLGTGDWGLGIGGWEPRAEDCGPRTEDREPRTEDDNLPIFPRPLPIAPHVRVRNLEVAYAGQQALGGIDLELWGGQIVAIMGRNGAGKTTLLRTIVGLVVPRRGAVEVGGRTTRGRSVAAICREVGYLPQDPGALLFAETARDELLVTLANHGIGGEAAMQRADALLKTLGLEQYAAAYPRDLSVGERQRVAIGAIAVVEPQTLLLDEPTRGLDYAAKAGLASLLRGWRDEGKAIAVVTHDVEFVAASADRVVLLGNGTLLADGPPGEVLGASPLFAPQVARLFPGSGWLTVADALRGLGFAADRVPQSAQRP